MSKTVDPFTAQELDDAKGINQGSPLEVVFSAPDLHRAFSLIENLLSERFLSIRPSEKIADVTIARPTESSSDLMVVAHTGVQMVIDDERSLFDLEMEEVAERSSCLYVCSGADVAADLIDDVLH